MRSKIALLLVFIFMLCSCGRDVPQELNTESGRYSNSASSGVWISFSEINAMLSSDNGFEKELDSAVENLKSLKIENVYIHVRSYCDSLYPSEYFPLISKAEGYNYDIFQKMLTAFQNEGIKVHAWINPYRVLTSSSDIEKLNQGSPAYKWLKDENQDNDVNVCFYKGIYLNPAESEVRQLVIDGIKEIVSRYDVDGIHFDDYFYPTQSEDFDKPSFEKYISKAQTPLSLGDWRRANVNALISGCYSAIKFENKDILFSISPAASIDKNYNEFYADIKEWIEEGYIDCIIPQLYFGFGYADEKFCFDSLLGEWRKAASENTDIDLLIGLGAYKIGTENEADGTEWKTDRDIISRQAESCYKNDAVRGYVIFSYSSLFSDSDLNRSQREKYLQFINSVSPESNNG